VSGHLLANNALTKDFAAFFNAMLTMQNNDIEIGNIPVQFIGKEFVELFMEQYQTSGYQVIGLIREQKDLQISDIFSDDQSAIDSFIKSALENSKIKDKSGHVILNPEKDYIINEFDRMIILKQK
jgi:hypothetical protein